MTDPQALQQITKLIQELEAVGTSINNLITLLTPPPEEPQRTCKALANKSKFLNDEQRKKVIEYITDPKEQEAIKALPSHRRVSYIQKQLQERYSITLSFYHASNVIKEFCNE